ncbi:hypothetical protein VMCG_09504 [Cytospora schulzeri]|uniref:LCCL domain-containing protein n=1 Tax=Cytospora schulzeri TaxID=448051 RepID=A0A423VFY4_9PEZI|nr:hypothetical protein VMCG_09504 [Valsa malicola]
MAAPPEITLKNLSGKFTLNKTLSDSNDPILKIQGVGWIQRKAIGAASLTLTLKQYVDEAGKTHLDMEGKPSGGPAQVEQRTLDWDVESEVNHPLFGKGKARSKWVKKDEITDEYLAKGWEDGSDELILMQTTLDAGSITTLVHGFETVDGKRHYVRHVVVIKGSETAKVRMVYDYAGSA